MIGTVCVRAFLFSFLVITFVVTLIAAPVVQAADRGTATGPQTADHRNDGPQQDGGDADGIGGYKKEWFHNEYGGGGSPPQPPTGQLGGEGELEIRLDRLTIWLKFTFMWAIR